jgi:uncharacterized coiled-coil protein SlyX
MRAVYIGRHRLLPLQERALEELGITIARTIENLPTEPAALNALLAELQQEGIEAAVTVALPPHLLAAVSARLTTLVFEMRSTTFQCTEAAEKWVAEKPEARTYIPGRPGEPVRGLEFIGVNKVRVIVESTRVWPQSASQ